MDMSGQPHDLAALPLENKVLLPIEHEAGWAQELVRMFWRRKLLFLLGIEPWIMQPIAWSPYQMCYTSLCSYRQINVSSMLAVCISSSITVTNCIYQNPELAIFHNSSCLKWRVTLQSHTNLKILHAGTFLKIDDYERSWVCKVIIYSDKLKLFCDRARVAQCV